MAVAASLDIVLAARTQKLDAGLAKGQRSIASFTKGVLALGGAYLTFNRLADTFVATFEELESLGRVADNLGIGADALAAFHLQAEDVSISVETLNTALARLGRTTSDTTTPLDKQFIATAERVRHATSQIEKIKIATEVFGKQGAELVPILNQGAAGFDNAMKSAEEYGLAVSDIDMANIRRMDDAIDDMAKAWKGLKREVVASTSEMAQGAAILGEDFIKMLRKIAHGMDAFSAAREVGLERGQRIINDIEEATTAAQRRLDELNAEKLKSDMDDLQDSLDHLRDSLRSPAQELYDNFQRDFNIIADALEADIITMEEFNRLTKQLAERFDEAREAMEKLKLPGDFLGLKERLAGLFDSGGGVLRSLDEWFENTSKQLRDFFEETTLTDIGAPGAAEKGSIEAFDAMAQIQRQSQQTEMQQLARLDAVKSELTAVGGRIVSAIGKITGLLPADI